MMTFLDFIGESFDKPYEWKEEYRNVFEFMVGEDKVEIVLVERNIVDSELRDSYANKLYELLFLVNGIAEKQDTSKNTKNKILRILATIGSILDYFSHKNKKANIVITPKPGWDKIYLKALNKQKNYKVSIHHSTRKYDTYNGDIFLERK